MDRLTKYIVLRYALYGYEVNKFLSIDLVINRGISWGMMHSQKTYIFIFVTALIICMVALFGMYTWNCLREQECSGGEFLVFSGALSNIIDRFLYGGVLDFISLSYSSWSFPFFNIADISIVVGIGLMIFYSFKRDSV